MVLQKKRDNKDKEIMETIINTLYDNCSIKGGVKIKTASNDCFNGTYTFY